MNESRVVRLEQGDQGGGSDDVTPLEACLLHVASTLDRPTTLAALHAAQSGAQGSLTVRDAIVAAERAGIQAAFGKRRLKDFDSTLTPAILLLDDNRAVVLHEVLPGGRLAVFDPALGEGLGEVAFDAIEAVYSGYALLMRAEHREDIALQGQRPAGALVLVHAGAEQVGLHAGDPGGDSRQFPRAFHLAFHHGGL